MKAVKKGKYNEIKAYLQEQGVNDDQLSQLDRFLPFKEKDKTIYTNISTVRIGKFQVKKSVDENYFEVFSDDADSVSKLLTALNEHVKSEKDQAEFLFEKDQAEFLDEQIKNRAHYACIKDKKIMII
ncbi:MAG: hypothetical protein N3G80_02640 [Candidatus Micrarchaeota archaeon]|nr:hypothetical protein [Candidatus Micrarchaeota archaeon]